jgi:hypothetical protein
VWRRQCCLSGERSVNERSWRTTRNGQGDTADDLPELKPARGIGVMGGELGTFKDWWQRRL